METLDCVKVLMVNLKAKHYTYLLECTKVLMLGLLTCLDFESLHLKVDEKDEHYYLIALETVLLKYWGIENVLETVYLKEYKMAIATVRLKRLDCVILLECTKVQTCLLVLLLVSLRVKKLVSLRVEK